MLHLLRQEIVVFKCCKIICCCGLATQRLAISDFLDVTQPAGDTLIAVAVERIEVQGHPCIAPGVDFISIQDRFDGPVNDLWRSLGISIDEPMPLVGFIVPLCISVSERQLDRSLVRLLPSELSDTILIALTVCVSLLGIRTDTEYFSALPLMDTGSQPWK